MLNRLMKHLFATKRVANVTVLQLDNIRIDLLVEDQVIVELIGS